MAKTAAIAGSLPGIFVSKKKLIIVGIFIAILVLIVIILAALLGKANSEAARLKKGMYLSLQEPQFFPKFFNFIMSQAS